MVLTVQAQLKNFSISLRHSLFDGREPGVMA